MREGPLAIPPVEPGRMAERPKPPQVPPARGLSLPVAIILAGLLLSGAYLLHGRYESRTAYNMLWRVDRLTGDVATCGYGTGATAGDLWCTKIKRASDAPN